jgi:hypothetical protein
VEIEMKSVLARQLENAEQAMAINAALGRNVDHWIPELQLIAGILIAGEYDRDLFEEMLEGL